MKRLSEWSYLELLIFQEKIEKKNDFFEKKLNFRVKIDEIREIIKEHKEITLPEEYKKKWIKMGYRNIVPPEDSDVDPNENWSHIMGQVITHHQSSIMKHFNPMRDVMEV